MAGEPHGPLLDLRVQDVANDFLGQVGLQVIDAVGQHLVPELELVPLAEHLGLHLDASAVKFTAEFRRRFVGVNFHDGRVQFIEPIAKAVLRMPLGHHRDLAARQFAHAQQHGALVEHDHLPLHSGGLNLLDQQRRVDVLAVQVQIDLALDVLQALLKREQLRPGESAREPGASVEFFQLGQRVLFDGAMAVGLAVETAVVKQHVLAILGQPRVDFDPFQAIGHAHVDGRLGVLGRLASHAPVYHDLKSPRRSERLEELERRLGGRGPRGGEDGKAHDHCRDSSVHGLGGSVSRGQDRSASRREPD